MRPCEATGDDGCERERRPSLQDGFHTGMHIASRGRRILMPGGPTWPA